MILLKNKDKKANIKIGNNIEIKDGNDFPFDLTLYGRSTQATRSGKNLAGPIQGSATYDDITVSSIENGISITGTSTVPNTFSLIGDSIIRTSNYYQVQTIQANNSTKLSLGTYILSYNTSGVNLLAFYGNIGDRLDASTPIPKGTPFTITEDEYVWLGLYVGGGVTTNYDITDIQLESGSTTTDYEPYGVSPSPDYPSEVQVIKGNNSIKIENKNLFDVPLDSSITSNIQYKTYRLEPNTKYTISTNTYLSNDAIANIFIDLGTSLTPSTSANGVNGSKTITTDSTGYVTIGYRNNAMQLDYSTGMYYCQLEKGTQATPYEPYQSNTLAIDLQGNELCSLPRGTKDEVNITNGEALLIKRVGKVILDGSESWRKAQIGTTGKYYFTFVPSWGQQTTNGKLLYCDYFVPSNTWNEQVVGMWLDTNMIIKTQGSLDNTEDLTSFKTWLSTHNVEVLYELAEPETINLGTVEMPHTYEGVSNITNSADTEMIVKYYKKFEFDKILRSGYNIDEQEYEIAKKQMANGKRKKILSSYVDCIIKIDLGLLDNKTYQEYKEQLEDGEYEYWSYKYNQYKKANFILTKPSITTEYAYDDDIGIDDMEITLEKSSDVS